MDKSIQAKMDKTATCYNALTVHRERAYYLKRLEQYENAKHSYDEAYSDEPSDVRNLIGRSQVCALALRPRQAYKDAALALELEPNNMTAHNVQAQALFTMSHYEESLIMNHRGFHVRKKPSYFWEGIHQGTETIDDCIGKNAGDVMLDFLPLIKEQEELKDKKATVRKPLHKCRIPKEEKVVILPQTEARKQLSLSRVLSLKYLGQMAEDKHYLKKLFEDRRLQSANVKGSAELQALATEAHKTLIERQEMLRSQRPYYAVKFAEKSESKYLNKVKKAILAQDRIVSTRIADSKIKEIEACLQNRQVQEVIAKAERFQKFLDSKTCKVLPDKDAYVSKLYRIVGDAYLSLYRVSFTQSQEKKNRRTRFLMGLPIKRVTSYDSVIRNYPSKYGNLNLVIEKFKEIIPRCENSFMRCWVLHDLARLHLIQKNTKESKIYAKQCQSEAQDIDSPAWWLNACFVLLSGEMKLGNLQEVRFHVEKAYEWSKGLQNAEQVQTFLRDCVRIVSEPVYVDERNVREKQILSVMDDEVRVEAQHLFKKISLLPERRRLEVLPSKAFYDLFAVHEPERRKNKQKGISVVPGIEKGIPVDPKSGILGYQLF